jgi:hypothetical protein
VFCQGRSSGLSYRRHRVRDQLVEQYALLGAGRSKSTGDTQSDSFVFMASERGDGLVCRETQAQEMRQGAQDHGKVPGFVVVVLVIEQDGDCTMQHTYLREILRRLDRYGAVTVGLEREAHGRVAKAIVDFVVVDVVVVDVVVEGPTKQRIGAIERL